MAVSGVIRIGALALALIVLVAGCAHRAELAPATSAKSAGTWLLPADELGTQRLFRVRVQGPDGAVGLRLVLRIIDPGKFLALASDGFGRAAWSLDLSAGEVTVLDHRRRTYCRAGAAGSPEPGLASIPADWLPAVLLGYLPSPPRKLAVPASGRIEFTDQEERRWAAVFADGSLQSWTLSGAEGPRVWWTRRANEKILSHREGLQFRWREVVRERLAAAPAAVEIPPDYRETPCDEPDLPELRQDQPPP